MVYRGKNCNANCNANYFGVKHTDTHHEESKPKTIKPLCVTLMWRVISILMDMPSFPGRQQIEPKLT